MLITKRNSWVGRHKRVPWEIIHSPSGIHPDGTWCAYLSFSTLNHPEIRDLQLLGKTFDADSTDYHVNDFFNRFDWHGGITFYEETRQGTHIFIKIGCDYAHLGDDNFTRDENTIMTDIENIIDEYREIFPEKKEKENVDE